MYGDSPKEASVSVRGSIGMAQLHRETLRDRLENQKRTLEGALADVNQALAFIDKNPDFEKFHDVVGKAGY